MRVQFGPELYFYNTDYFLAPLVKSTLSFLNQKSTGCAFQPIPERSAICLAKTEIHLSIYVWFCAIFTFKTLKFSINDILQIQFL